MSSIRWVNSLISCSLPYPRSASALNTVALPFINSRARPSYTDSRLFSSTARAKAADRSSCTLPPLPSNSVLGNGAGLNDGVFPAPCDFSDAARPLHLSRSPSVTSSSASTCNSFRALRDTILSFRQPHVLRHISEGATRVHPVHPCPLRPLALSSIAFRCRRSPDLPISQSPDLS